MQFVSNLNIYLPWAKRLKKKKNNQIHRIIDEYPMLTGFSYTTFFVFESKASYTSISFDVFLKLKAYLFHFKLKAYF